MSLVKSRELFGESSFPVTVEKVIDRTLIQKELHRHEYFEMLYVEKGALVNKFKGTEIVMKPGDMLIMKPYVLHLLDDASRKKGRKAFCCSFLPQAVDSDIQSLEALKGSCSPNRYFFKPFISLADEGISAVQLKFDAEKRKKVAELLSALKEQTQDTSERGTALTRYHFLALLSFLTEEYERHEGVDQTVQADLSVPVSRYLEGLRKTLNYIHDHYAEPLALEDMAAMSGASETYFCRLFKHETGMTFLNYLNGLRIERACVLLRDTTDNALDICYEVGFNDYTHFGRQFKKHVGMSPADYRKQNPHVRRYRET
ncbi:AraC family transcriptional regulator [Pontiella agarivorans]|uniref:AraC family transcriptional regulator n=1 Tax=Pontiella agarivorans TaxID=3038953 RepID=A0ABU5MTS3_9BACT|nr:AraC family transcriptional regulator [Pontiella agarivorans]MDZ8117609.1 AraC family transcriptional regulator [Pontiella agarivorans]